jgi:hypothetical protein
MIKRLINLSVTRMNLIPLLFSIPVILHGQPDKPALMPQYLFPDFSSSRVIFKSGQILNPIINYNIVSERMVYLENQKYFDLTNTEMIDTIYLQLLKFVPFGKTFFELLQSRPIPLFIQHKGELVQAGTPVGYGATSQTVASDSYSSIHQASGSYNLTIPDNYTVSVSRIYWISKDGKMLDFKSQKEFLNLFPDKSDMIKAFIKKNRLKIDKPEDLIQIVNYTCTLK